MYIFCKIQRKVKAKKYKFNIVVDPILKISSLHIFYSPSAEEYATVAGDDTYQKRTLQEKQIKDQLQTSYGTEHANIGDHSFYEGFRETITEIDKKNVHSSKNYRQICYTCFEQKPLITTSRYCTAKSTIHRHKASKLAGEHSSSSVTSGWFTVRTIETRECDVILYALSCTTTVCTHVRWIAENMNCWIMIIHWY